MSDDLVNVRYWSTTYRTRSTSTPGPGGRHILIDDPSGNPIELFQPAGN
jgi:hypothetical protein